MLNRTCVACYVNMHLYLLVQLLAQTKQSHLLLQPDLEYFQKEWAVFGLHARTTLHGESDQGMFCCLLALTWWNKVLWLRGTESGENKFCLFLCPIPATLLSQLVSKQIYDAHSLTRERCVKRHVFDAVIWLKVSFKSHTVYGPQYTLQLILLIIKSVDDSLIRNKSFSCVSFTLACTLPSLWCHNIVCEISGLFIDTDDVVQMHTHLLFFSPLYSWPCLHQVSISSLVPRALLSHTVLEPCTFSVFFILIFTAATFTWNLNFHTCDSKGFCAVLRSREHTVGHRA